MNTPNFNIREALANDLPAIIEIFKKGVLKSVGFLDDAVDLDKYFQSLYDQTNADFKIWVAENDTGKILGWQSFLPCRVNPIVRNYFGESSTYVHDGKESHGVGHALMEYAIAEAKKSNLQYIIGYVAESNIKMRRIVEVMGYEQVGVIPGTLKNFERPNLVVYIITL